jgi:serine/threonine protein kinase
MSAPIREACPRCGTPSAEAVVSPSGEEVCLGCLLSLTRRTAAELETARLAEMDTVLTGAAPEPPGAQPSFPNYEILGLLGKGGMGVVYKARQKGLDRIVALKVLRPGVDDDEEGIKRFLNEARSAARLQHPNIVSIHEVSGGEGRLFFSMEFVDGRSLAEWLGEPGRTFPEIARLLRKVALAVQAAHEMGVVHRDLKPSNILVDRSGEPKVTDFGIAKDITADARIT